MKILFLGNFIPLYSSENYYLKTLQIMGHEVITAQENEISGIALSDRITNDSINYFFWVHTHGFKTPGIEEFLVLCRMRGIPSFAYHLDLYFGIQRERQILTDPFFTVDHFFTVDKMMAMYLNAEREAQFGKNNLAVGHFLPAGVYEPECFYGTPDRNRYPHDIIFTGSKGYHPEWPYRAQLIDWLSETYKDRFGHYGGGGLPTVRGPELNNLYASAKIVIGDTLCKDFTYPYYSSDRLFEATGRGAFVIYPSIKGLPEFYTGLSEIVYYDFNNWAMLKSLIDYYLVYDDHREKIRKNGFERAIKEHTYRHRLQFILDTLKSYQ